jgi:RNA polymerase sigma factor (sigma-70 family)
LDDNVLVGAALAGDQEAFAQLFERYRRYVYTIAYKIVLDEDDALDVTQNVFLAVAENLGTYKGRGPFRAWLAAIAAHQAYTCQRRTERRKENVVEPRIAEELRNAAASTDGINPYLALETEERLRLIDWAMRALSSQQRAILTLRLKEEMRPMEIAERLGIPAKQVRSQLHRAISRIREMLRREKL